MAKNIFSYLGHLRDPIVIYLNQVQFKDGDNQKGYCESFHFMCNHLNKTRVPKLHCRSSVCICILCLYMRMISQSKVPGHSRSNCSRLFHLFYSL